MKTKTGYAILGIASLIGCMFWVFIAAGSSMDLGRYSSVLLFSLSLASLLGLSAIMCIFRWLRGADMDAIVSLLKSSASIEMKEVARRLREDETWVRSLAALAIAQGRVSGHLDTETGKYVSDTQQKEDPPLLVS